MNVRLIYIIAIGLAVIILCWFTCGDGSERGKCVADVVAASDSLPEEAIMAPTQVNLYFDNSYPMKEYLKGKGFTVLVYQLLLLLTDWEGNKVLNHPS